jgi:hypothetical protein
MIEMHLSISIYIRFIRTTCVIISECSPTSSRNSHVSGPQTTALPRHYVIRPICSGVYASLNEAYRTDGPQAAGGPWALCRAKRPCGLGLPRFFRVVWAKLAESHEPSPCMVRHKLSIALDSSWIFLGQVVQWRKQKPNTWQSASEVCEGLQN